MPCDAHYTVDNLQDEKSPCFPGVPSTDHSQTCYAAEEVDSSVNTVGGLFLRRIEIFCHPNSIKDDSNPVSETGIKNRSRQPRNPPNLMNSTSQGTAPRRLRLWWGPRRESKYSNRSKEDESQSQRKQDAEIAHKNDPNLAQKHGQNSRVRMPSPKISGLLSVRGGSGSMKVFACGVDLTTILSVLLGVWICPKLQALQG